MTSVPSELLMMLELDVTRTLGEKYRHFVGDAANNVSVLEISDPSQKFVDDVQRRIHDECIDTVWPGCPRHLNHPLWYDGVGWVCERDEIQIAPLGGLRPVQPPERRTEGIVRQELEELQQRWSAEDDRDKLSNRATMRLAELYRTLDNGDRSIFDRVLNDWLQSADPGKRFDAQVLIREFKMCSALPAVRQALASWRRTLAEHADRTKSGEYGLARSDALATVQMLEPLVRDLEATCPD